MDSFSIRDWVIVLGLFGGVSYAIFSSWRKATKAPTEPMRLPSRVVAVAAPIPFLLAFYAIAQHASFGRPIWIDEFTQFALAAEPTTRDAWNLFTTRAAPASCTGRPAPTSCSITGHYRISAST